MENGLTAVMCSLLLLLLTAVRLMSNLHLNIGGRQEDLPAHSAVCPQGAGHQDLC